MFMEPPSLPRPDNLFPYTTLFRSMTLSLAFGALPDIDASVPQPAASGIGARPDPAAGNPQAGGADTHARDSVASCHYRSHRAMSTKRSEEPTSELQYLMRISYAVFC